MDAIPASFKLGFLGAGQLARMSALEAFKLGIQVVSYGSSHGMEPLNLVTPFQFTGSFDDEEKLIQFAKSCDLVTLENEFLDSELLKRVRDKSGTPMYPSPESFRLIESKLIEKETFSEAGIPVAPFGIVSNKEEMADFGEKHGWPYLLKSSKGGYDGYGNEIVKNIDEALNGFDKLGGNAGHDILAEAFIPFDRELAVSVARNDKGTVVFPCVETIQINHICRKVLAPAPIDKDILEKAQKMAIAATQAIDGKGVFAFEFFLTKDGQLLLNESAPRPHNSAHYSMEACSLSQFALHVRAVLDLPLPQPVMTTKAAVMVNILGTQNRKAVTENVSGLLKETQGYMHIYGKESSKIGRKMGHFTLLGEDVQELLTIADKAVEKIKL